MIARLFLTVKDFFRMDMIEIISFFIGISAVVMFLLSYQQKTRKRIILFNATSRVLYIIQYFLLGAFAGAVLDILGTVSSVIAQRKDKGFVKKHTPAVFIAVNLAVVAAGVTTMIVAHDYFGVFSLIGVLLHTIAFWIDDERKIRLVSLAGSPFWLVYNFISRAYGSVIGDALSIGSILVAIVRYDILPKRKSKQSADEAAK